MSAAALRRLALALLAAGIVAARACPDDTDDRRSGDAAGDGFDASLAAAETVEAYVLRVAHGDSFEVEIDGRRERVRYIGIDAPELSDARPDVRELARSASAANRSLVGGRRVRLEFDERLRDPHDRLLAWVRLGDTLANEWLVREGFARAGRYPPNDRHQARLEEAEAEARAAARRIWDGGFEGGP